LLQPGELSLALFFLLLFLLLLIIRWFRKQCQTLQASLPAENYSYWRLTIQLVQRSLYLIGAIILIITCGQVHLSIQAEDFSARLVVDILLIVLFTKWCRGFLRYQFFEKEEKKEKRARFEARILISGIRYFSILLVLLKYVLGDMSVLFLLTRLAFELYLIAWSLLYFKIILSGLWGHNTAAERFSPPFQLIISALGYGIPLGGMLLEFSGYGNMALFWFISWGRTVVILLWAYLLFKSLREWSSTFQKGPEEEETDSTETRQPFLWLLSRIGWLVWFSAAVTGIFIAWGAGQVFFMKFFKLINEPFSMGSMTLKTSGFFYALLIVLITQTAVKLWKYFLLDKVLNQSGLQPGLQNSITTVSAYCLWTFGILIALSALGVSATSITVAFGALGIGLGFGLQNIFNNFVSGLILLFERPIQTGDSVEIGGRWGIVKKINVRSTVVQTWDNASLIIPNSELISQQVTNWSFKDLSLRRDIIVGVIYGSDTQLVKEILLAVAKDNKLVLQKPEPDVLFHDFGDSALVFKLRVWTTVNYMLALESQIRFEIDRRFNEKGIVIAFPQRDIHIRTWPEKMTGEGEDENT